MLNSNRDDGGPLEVIGIITHGDTADILFQTIIVQTLPIHAQTILTRVDGGTSCVLECWSNTKINVDCRFQIVTKSSR